MDRRQFLQTSSLVASAAALGTTAFAQAPSAPGKSGLVVYSKHLQWLRTPQDVATAVIDIGLERLDLTVAPYPGHVDPAKVKTDLPAFVSALKQRGIAVPVVTTGIVDADSPNAEAILDAASSAGVTHYVWGGLTYQAGTPYQAQLDALKPRVQKLAKLNEKYKIKGLYHPVAGATNVGSSFFDILDVLQTVNPQFTGIQYDTASLLQPVRDVFVSHMRLGAPYIGGMALNDAAITLDIPFYEYGPFDPNSSQDANAGPAGDNTGNADGDPLAFGGGGRPLPYKYHPMRVGTGMIDLILIGRTLKEIGFNGPIETQVNWPLGGAESGADKVNLKRQSILGQLKRDRLTVEHGFFAAGWNIDIARPAFLVARDRGGAAPAPAGRGGRGGRGAAQ
jgi:sugar phosphate isomerase/epimerase